MELPGQRVLVTGASGFAGANLVQRLTTLGADVYALVRAPHPRRMPALAGARPVRCDLNDRHAVLRALAEVLPRAVFHLAAEGAAAALRHEPGIATANVLGTAHLLEGALASGCQRFIHVGCASEVGALHETVSHAALDELAAYEHDEGLASAAEAAAPERAPLQPLPSGAELGGDGDEPGPAATAAHALAAQQSVFGATKAAATLLALQAARLGRLPTVVLRPFALYGAWDSPVRLLPSAIRAALRGEELLLRPGRIPRDLLFAEDFVDACLAAARAPGAPGELFELGCGRAFSNHEVVAEVELACGESIRIRPAPEDDAPVQAQPRWAPQMEKAHRLLGWAPRHALPEGISRTVDWFLSHPERLEPPGA